MSPDYIFYLAGHEDDPLLKVSLPNEAGNFPIEDGAIDQTFTADNPCGLAIQVRRLSLNSKNACLSGCKSAHNKIIIDHTSPKQITFSGKNEARIGSGNTFIKIIKTG